MLMVTYFYAQLLLVSISPLLLIFALFMLKRGIRQCRRGLREMALAIIYIIIAKILTYDVYHLALDSFCGDFRNMISCDYRWVMAFRIIAGVMLIPATYGMYQAYKFFINRNNPSNRSLSELNIRLWANISMIAVLIFAGWLIAPWVGYLTVGHAPDYLVSKNWHYYAVICFLMIGMTFWRYEDCSLTFKTKEEKRLSHHAWVPRDTLWLATAVLVFVYPIMFFSESILLSR